MNSTSDSGNCSLYQVIRGADGQWILWRLDSPVPTGWTPTTIRGPRSACQQYLRSLLQNETEQLPPPRPQHSVWFTHCDSEAGKDLRAIIFPFAGAGLSGVRALFGKLPPWLNASVAMLPGRDQRSHETTISVPAMVGELAKELTKIAAHELLLIGHSMGALLAMAVARELEQLNDTRTKLVIVSGHNAPSHRRVLRADTSDAELLEQVRQLGGMDERLMDSRDFLQFFLPFLRRDLRLCAELLDLPQTPVSLPLLALSGQSDTLTTPEGLASWSSLTTAPFFMHEFEGEHFYLLGRQAEVWEVIQTVMATIQSGTSQNAAGTGQS